MCTNRLRIMQQEWKGNESEVQASVSLLHPSKHSVIQTLAADLNTSYDFFR